MSALIRFYHVRLFSVLFVKCVKTLMTSFSAAANQNLLTGTRGEEDEMRPDFTNKRAAVQARAETLSYPDG